ncbi:MAG: 3-deoxy-8-phosphooctulonate synthase [Candidatus Krumholzibacteriia bacterium]
MEPLRIGSLIVEEGRPPLLIAGPCVIEDESETVALAERIASLPVTGKYQFVFKASYSKDNRSAAGSYRGVGLDDGLRILDKVRTAVGCPVLSDVHSVAEAASAAEVLDVLQIPAFMSRQTSLLEAAAATGRAVNVKKGQFLSPAAAGLAAEKVRQAGGKKVMLTERGTTFGYQDLLVDFRSFPRMKAFGCPVIFDVTHSLQRPGGLGDRSGGEPELAGTMARAAAAVPCDGFFVETHPEPARAKSDGASMLEFSNLERLLEDTVRIFDLAREITSRGARSR